MRYELIVVRISKEEAVTLVIDTDHDPYDLLRHVSRGESITDEDGDDFWFNPQDISTLELTLLDSEDTF